MSRLTTDPNDPRLGHGGDKEPGLQNEVYLVLSAEERAKGFVRPVRDRYVHVGNKPRYPLRDLTSYEVSLWGGYGYVKYEEYPPSQGGPVGKLWTQEQLDKVACGTITVMGLALAETYARNPRFYGATYCCVCRMHLPVGEFVWAGTDERVGS